MDNYFNYFTEIEECFRRCRNTPTLLSTLDWALIESWKEAGIPLEAVLTGVERAFEKSRRRRKFGREVNSLAYCTQEVFRAAEAAQAPSTSTTPQSSLNLEEIVEYSRRNQTALEEAGRVAQQNGQSREAGLAKDLTSAARTLAGITPQASGNSPPDLEKIERLLSALEDQLTASLTRAASVELLAQFRHEVDSGLAPYRRKMTAVQIESLERQFLKKRLFEHYRIPRLSLFYL